MNSFLPSHDCFHFFPHREEVDPSGPLQELSILLVILAIWLFSILQFLRRDTKNIPLINLAIFYVIFVVHLYILLSLSWCSLPTGSCFHSSFRSSRYSAFSYNVAPTGALILTVNGLEWSTIQECDR